MPVCHCLYRLVVLPARLSTLQVTAWCASACSQLLVLAAGRTTHRECQQGNGHRHLDGSDECSTDVAQHRGPPALLPYNSTANTLSPVHNLDEMHPAPPEFQTTRSTTAYDYGEKMPTRTLCAGSLVNCRRRGLQCCQSQRTERRQQGHFRCHSLYAPALGNHQAGQHSAQNDRQ